MREEERTVVAAVEALTVRQLRSWVRKGWIRPTRDRRQTFFTEIDVARIRLICHLKHELRFDEETIPVVLSLIDQIHGLRHELRVLGQAVEQQPSSVRRRISSAVRSLSDGRNP